MKLRVDFGYLRKETMWFKDLTDFPLVITKSGQNWEWLCHDIDPSGEFDHVLTFTLQSAFSALNMVGQPTKFEDLFPDDPYGCQCGAKYERGFENAHYGYCPRFRKW